MAFQDDKIEKILELVAKKLDISDKLFSDAEIEYRLLGEWINEKTSENNKNYEVEIYPQGSFALGTVIRPISDEDDYDLDVLCEIKKDYNFSARFLKCRLVLDWLRNYRKIEKIINKRRCWHVEYNEMHNFHMDVIPAVNGVTENQPIKITDHNKENDTYEYILSNPYGYRNWFLNKCNLQKKRAISKGSKITILAETKIEKLKKTRSFVPLQRSIQLLKRHRDIIFEYRANKDDKPISIIITTIAGECCSDCDSIWETLICFPSRAKNYLENNIINGEYHVNNPSYSGENFADKWNIKPEKAQAFFSWLKELQNDFVEEKLTEMSQINLFKKIKKLFGENIGIAVINEMKNIENEKINNGTLMVNTSTGMLTERGTIKVPRNHHYHQ